ncbi:hypothetical protein BT96DRAFT_940214 [Gymnopus androsaceus JB14]|uniref:Uncharacterized protein n=1 Tax=Gymnopus androsaceus JB14 TaxID=1447944 RepID=A0A6A4HL67_9AGAR|nr:hypothetical protein BT96DRAFT_940214 [Gymnopus androsaceus JB14]
MSKVVKAGRVVFCNKAMDMEWDDPIVEIIIWDSRKGKKVQEARNIQDLDNEKDESESESSDDSEEDRGLQRIKRLTGGCVTASSEAEKYQYLILIYHLCPLEEEELRTAKEKEDGEAVVMCRLGPISKAPAMAQIALARADQNVEPSPTWWLGLG